MEKSPKENKRMQEALQQMEKANYSAAIRILEKLLPLHPTDISVSYQLGLAHLALGETEPAITHFTKSIQKDPTFAEGYNNRGSAYFESNQKDRSEERRVGKECRSRWSPYH